MPLLFCHALQDLQMNIRQVQVQEPQEALQAQPEQLPKHLLLLKIRKNSVVQVLQTKQQVLMSSNIQLLKVMI